MNSNLTYSDRAFKMTADFEGLFLQAYDDATDHIVRPGQKIHGTLTIGLGHTSAAGPPHVYPGMTMTEDEAWHQLAVDIIPVQKEVLQLVKVKLNQNQFDALVDFQWNCGWLTHPHCSLLEAVNSNKMELAEEDFMLYDRAKGVVLVGLDRRRAAERTLFHLTPEVVTV